MPLKVRCPNLHVLLIKDDLVGRPLHCPVCHAHLGAQHDPKPLTDGDVLTEFDWALSAEDLPETSVPLSPHKPETKAVVASLPTRLERRHRLRVVGYGLLFLAGAMALFLLAMIPWQMVPDLSMAPWLILASLLCELVGTVCFFWTPRAAGTRGTLVGALATAVVRIALMVLTVVFLPEWGGTWKLAAMLALDLLAWMTHKVFLFWYLHLVAEYVQAEGLAHDIRRLIQQAIALPVCSAAWCVLAPVVTSLPVTLGTLGMIATLVTGFALVGWWGLYLIRYLAALLTLRGFVAG